ncbi:hypothetical protein K492DRAFT_209102 [Lichtheimia hyalospora FSU 10163]|nr:hypothetical protein K492DRAFT_209102 [Lichtheimia hyalospora FSU 10163]
MHQQPMDATQLHHVTSTTPPVEASTERQLGLLHDRATASAASAKFQAALNDVTFMKTMAPSSSMGFLCECQVYQMQGRYGACIDTCDQGLSVVSSSDPYYQQLLSIRSIALKHYNAYVDFMKELPVDIIEIIVDKLLGTQEIEADELFEYISVSHLWQERILQHSRDIHIVSEPDDKMSDQAHLLKQAAPHITALTSYYYSTPAYQLFQQAMFSSLQRLNLHYETYDDDPSPSFVLGSLASVQSTLTHLDIQSQAYNNSLSFSIGDLVDTFPLLVSLECNCAINNNNLISKSYPRLKELKISSTSENNFDSDQLDDLTRQLPELEILYIRQCVDTKALSMIQDNCPQLKILMYNDYIKVDPYNERIAYNPVEEPTSGDPGLQRLSIDQGREENLVDVDMLDITTSIVRNAHSLQSIHLRCQSTTDVHEHQAMYTSVIFSHLTYYRHEIFCDEDVLLAMCVIRRSPNLKHIDIFKGRPEYEDQHEIDYDMPRSPQYDNLDQVFVAMSGLQHLEVANIQIKGCNVAAGLEQFLSYHSSIESKLRDLYVPKRTALSSNTLDLLTRLPCLEELSIQPRIQESDQWFSVVYQFLEKLAEQCPRIHSLSLYDIHGNHLPALRQFPNLQSLWIKTAQITEANLLTFLEFPKLEYVNVHSRSQLDTLDPDIEQLLRNRIRICTVN